MFKKLNNFFLFTIMNYGGWWKILVDHLNVVHYNQVYMMVDLKEHLGINLIINCY